MVSIEKVTADSELHEIAELAGRIWHEFFPAIISAEQIDYMIKKFQSYGAMKNQTENEGYCYLSVRCDGELCGYIAVKPEQDSRFFLSKFYLRSDMRGKGIASEMMQRVFEGAKAHGKKSVYLTVNKYNTHAVDVYHKIGFETVDSVVADIGNGFVMDDYIMEYKL